MLLTMPISQVTKAQAQLNRNFRRAFCQDVLLAGFLPTKQETLAAIEPVFPELLSLDVQAMLETVGIALITQYGDSQISLSVATSPELAIAQKVTCSSTEHDKIRQALGISHHWVCNIDHQEEFFWYHDHQDWMNAFYSFVEVDLSPKCWVFDQARNLNDKTL